MIHFESLPTPTRPNTKSPHIRHQGGRFDTQTCSDPDCTSYDPARNFLINLAGHLEKLSCCNPHILSTLSPARMADLYREIHSIAENAGLVNIVALTARCEAHLAQAGAAMNAESKAKAMHLEYLLYEELAFIADTVAQNNADLPVDLRLVLRAWCSKNVFESLLQIQYHLQALGSSETTAEALATHCQAINTGLRRVYHACLHLELETAAHLSLSILDLLARAESGQIKADPIFLFIIKSFIHDIDVILNAISKGNYADLSHLDHIREAAAEIAFISSGTVPATQIETRLNLPPMFHKVLTPDSVRNALKDLDAGYRFYIVRADLNANKALGENLLTWAESGNAHLISNVTVFIDDYVLFDFLLSTPLQERALCDAIAKLDPSGELLFIMMVLVDRNAASSVRP